MNVKKYLYRGYLALLAIAAAYALYGIGHFKWMYHNIDKPLDFQVTGTIDSDISVVEFLNYSCQYCKQIHPAVKELMSVRKDVRYVARPVSFEEGPSDRLTRIALAAGLQGKFWEMHHALLENPDIIVSDDFVEETSSVYGIDYSKLTEDMQSKEVEKIMEDNYNALLHAGIQYTPSFMVNNEIYVSGDTLPTLTDLIEMVAAAEMK